jgi:endoglucanase
VHRRLILTALAGILIFGSWHRFAVRSARAAPSGTPPSIQGLHVSGNRILNGANQPIQILGINRSGTEYSCIQNNGIFDGPSDETSIRAIASWHTNAVRVPLNEDCWLNINGVRPSFGGANYQQAIVDYVDRLNRNGLIAILELHWSAPGATPATGQTPMPDLDHSPAFWTSVANTFQVNTSVIFDLFNEPFPDNNRDTTAGWMCWRDGGNCPGVNFPVAGMQQLVDTVRATGATNVIMLGGIQFSNALSQFLTFEPSDPMNGLAASWHVYNFNVCNNRGCWNATAAPVAAKLPLVTGEIGENDCAHGFIDDLMTFLDNHQSGYLGWTWNTDFDCGKGPGLITNYDGTPTDFGIGLMQHLAVLAK